MRLLPGLLLSLALLAPSLLASAGPARAEGGMVLLTVTGTLDKANRGPLDPFRDVLLAKYMEPFERAYVFDAADLAALSQDAVTLSYAGWDGQPHGFKGPRLDRVLAAAGATGKTVSVMAIDGYAFDFDAASVTRSGMILATEMDGKPLAVGGQGPLWLVFAPGSVQGLPGDNDAGLVWAVMAVTVR